MNEQEEDLSPFADFELFENSREKWGWKEFTEEERAIRKLVCEVIFLNEELALHPECPVSTFEMVRWLAIQYQHETEQLRTNLALADALIEYVRRNR